MHILITGAGGFLGQRLAVDLTQAGSPLKDRISRITLVDLTFPEHLHQTEGLEIIRGDLTDPAFMEGVLELKPGLIFHLAAVVSGQAEKEFGLGMEANYHASFRMLEYCRKAGFRPRIIFASSVAVFSSIDPSPIDENTAPLPLSSYGMQKNMVELLINEFSRRGWIDGRSLRLPTIAVRPGKPNAATSSFVSSIIREPLNGERAVCPVPPETEVWIQSPAMVIRNFVHAAGMEEESLGTNRTITLPGLTATIREMMESLEELSGSHTTELVSFEPDEFIRKIVLTWPSRFLTPRAEALGFSGDSTVNKVIYSYMEESGIT